MITEKQSFRFPGSPTASEIYYTLSPNTTCVTVSPSTGTVSPGTTVEFSFGFEDESCFDTIFTLAVWDDACEVPEEITFTVPSPCTSLDGVISNAPSSHNPYIFNVVPSGGNPSYNITWTYDTALFNLAGPTRGAGAQALELSPRFIETSSGIIVPNSTVITATITDSNNCIKTLSYIYSFCQPIASNNFVAASCVPSNTINSFSYSLAIGGVVLDVTTCAGTTNNWNTLELVYDTNQLYVTNDSNVLNIYAKAPSTATSRTIKYTVKNSQGIKSTEGTITVSLPICAAVNNPVIQTSTTKLLTADTGGTVKTLNLTSKVFASTSAS